MWQWALHTYLTISLKNVAATLYIHVPLHCYCSVHKDPTLQRYGHKYKKYVYQIQTNNCNDWKINVHIYGTCVHTCVKFELATTNTLTLTTVKSNTHEDDCAVLYAVVWQSYMTQKQPDTEEKGAEYQY